MVVWSGSSLAQEDVQQCATAYEQAQVLRNAGHLTQAQAQLRICVRDVCPDFVKVDCGQWLSDVTRDMPSVVFAADDAAGREIFDVRVTVDGAPLQASLDGRAIDLDPGQHDVVFQFQDRTLNQKLIVRQGEKNRVVKVSFPSQADTDGDGVLDAADRCPSAVGPEANRGCPEPIAEPAPESGTDPRLVGAIVSWSVGAVGIGSFIGFGLHARSIGNEGTRVCSGDAGCTSAVLDDYKSRERTSMVVANVSLGVGVAGVATGLVLFLLQQFDDSAAARVTESNLQVVAAPTERGSWWGLQGSF